MEMNDQTVPETAAADDGGRRASLIEEPPPPPPPMISVDIAGVLLQFSKTFVIVFPVYVLGYLGLSFSWVLIGLLVFFWWRRNRGNKRSRLFRALAFLEHEEKTLQENIQSTDLPAWIPDFLYCVPAYF
ncbi:extended synaptotagmin-2-A-like isoform X2 [Rhincodon typus]|uniref:extended synaptotagmin-2-A-like isoform X2 n=1 Tax=Rhincodon typus TaxID=259920 RepID=UPI002030F933|nr:extended synaptotagmin-2-A-like isoform X2 [Rhincodon typus]